MTRAIPDRFPDIVFAIDDAYCCPLSVLWQSMVETNSEIAGQLSITVLYEHLDGESMERLRFHAKRLGLRVELRPIAMPDLPYNVAYGGAKANYARLVIPDVLPDARQVLYLDADLIILDDLKPLLRTQLGNGQPLGAVRDPVNPTLGLGRALPGWQHLGLSPQREYFNSGVLLLDLATCGRDGVFERAWRAVSENPQMLRMWDQDALNLAAADNWYRLPARWNTAPLSALSRTPWIRYRAESLVPLADLIRAEDDAAIMHYITPSKPWRNLLPDGRPNAVYQRHFATVRSAEKHL